MSAHWKQRPEGGGRFAIWLIRSIGRYGGRRAGRACLWLITPYFLARRGPERRASRAWLSRALGRPATLPDVARHIHTFAATILDRIFLLSGELRRFDIAIEGLPALDAQLAAGRGVLLFGSHLGSFEALRVLAGTRPDLGLRVVLDKGHNPAMTQLLDALNPRVAATVIDAGRPGTEILMAIGEALAQGQMVALLVDRPQPGEPTEAVPFLGDPAPFPLAPWQVAAVLGAPVMLAFGLYRGGNRYDLRFEPFSDGETVPRQARRAHVASLIRRYAARLEDLARRYPYNWFNFYDYWARSDDDPAVRGEGGAGAGAGDDPDGAGAGAGVVVDAG
ncbi:MAG TPA: acyltransferase [Luteimonas sp.]|nr:acyltransferase [Luteimonas sp.]